MRVAWGVVASVLMISACSGKKSGSAGKGAAGGPSTEAPPGGNRPGVPGTDEEGSGLSVSGTLALPPADLARAVARSTSVDLYSPLTQQSCGGPLAADGSFQATCSEDVLAGAGRMILMTSEGEKPNSAVLISQGAISTPLSLLASGVPGLPLLSEVPSAISGVLPILGLGKLSLTISLGQEGALLAQLDSESSDALDPEQVAKVAALDPVPIGDLTGNYSVSCFPGSAFACDMSALLGNAPPVVLDDTQWLTDSTTTIFLEHHVSDGSLTLWNSRAQAEACGGGSAGRPGWKLWYNGTAYPIDDRSEEAYRDSLKTFWDELPAALRNAARKFEYRNAPYACMTNRSQANCKFLEIGEGERPLEFDSLVAYTGSITEERVPCIGPEASDSEYEAMSAQGMEFCRDTPLFEADGKSGTHLIFKGASGKQLSYVCKFRDPATSSTANYEQFETAVGGLHGISTVGADAFLAAKAWLDVAAPSECKDLAAFDTVAIEHISRILGTAAAIDAADALDTNVPPALADCLPYMPDAQFNAAGGPHPEWMDFCVHMGSLSNHCQNDGTTVDCGGPLAAERWSGLRMKWDTPTQPTRMVIDTDAPVSDAWAQNGPDEFTTMACPVASLWYMEAPLTAGDGAMPGLDKKAEFVDRCRNEVDDLTEAQLKEIFRNKMYIAKGLDPFLVAAVRSANLKATLAADANRQCGPSPNFVPVWNSELRTRTAAPYYEVNGIWEPGYDSQGVFRGRLPGQAAAPYELRDLGTGQAEYARVRTLRFPFFEDGKRFEKWAANVDMGVFARMSDSSLRMNFQSKASQGRREVSGFNLAAGGEDLHNLMEFLFQKIGD